MNRAPHIEIKETPKNLTNGTTWDRLSLQVWDKFLKCQQKEGTYTKKINMWKNMHCTVQVSLTSIFIRIKFRKIFLLLCPGSIRKNFPIMRFTWSDRQYRVSVRMVQT